ncbi:MAG TPA: protein-glutamate O-methyltransferase CheR [Pyrinomonadaceae bacterium]|nr:protein-glutamate O-methyltransferase CheR [Pyrinomonadaceae bacterium]
MSAQPVEELQLEDIEIQLLLEGLYRYYGFDFRNYAPASIKRRILESLREEGAETVSAFQNRVLHDAACLERFLKRLSVNVTAMFRDPSFYQTFRQKVVPMLRTYPFVRLWHAGCSTGEEVYSMAILLQEEGLYERCRLYATDMSAEALRQAREGIFPLASMQEYTSNYLQAGGRHFFSDYYTAQYDNVIFDSALKRNLIFSEHNLVTDGSFNEFHVILCRNVMIYFNKALQARVHNLIYESLTMFGVLGLGNKESLRFTPREGFYEELDQRDRLYRKAR